MSRPLLIQYTFPHKGDNGRRPPVCSLGFQYVQRHNISVRLGVAHGQSIFERVGGCSITEAGQALEILLRALPQRTLFNIHRFGSTYESIRSQLYEGLNR